MHDKRKFGVLEELNNNKIFVSLWNIYQALQHDFAIMEI